MLSNLPVSMGKKGVAEEKAVEKLESEVPRTEEPTAKDRLQEQNPFHLSEQIFPFLSQDLYWAKHQVSLYLFHVPDSEKSLSHYPCCSRYRNLSSPLVNFDSEEVEVWNQVISGRRS